MVLGFSGTITPNLLSSIICIIIVCVIIAWIIVACIIIVASCLVITAFLMEKAAYKLHLIFDSIHHYKKKQIKIKKKAKKKYKISCFFWISSNRLCFLLFTWSSAYKLCKTYSNTCKYIRLHIQIIVCLFTLRQTTFIHIFYVFRMF